MNRTRTRRAPAEIQAPSSREATSATRLCASLLALAGVLPACGAAAIESSKIEDSARRAVPVAVCIKPLPRRAAAPNTVPMLTSEDYWSMIFPSYDAASGTLDRAAPDCSGRPVLASQDLAQSEGPRTGPLPATAADVLVAPAPDGFKLVWLRTHHFSDGTAAGALAFVRARESYAEVYGIGLYRGNAARSRLGFERLGRDVLITAVDEGCAGVKPNQSCESNMVAFLSSGGQLVPSAKFALDRVQYGQAAGVGSVQYRLTATPIFLDRAIRLIEQVSVRDGSQTEIRKSDLERVFERRGTKLVANGESLWAQALAGAQPSQKPPKP